MTQQLDSKHDHHQRSQPLTRPRWRGTGLLAFGLLTLAACDPAANPELEAVSETEGPLGDPAASGASFELDADARELPVVVLGDPSAAVDALAGEAELVFASELDGVVGSEVLGASRALAVDLSHASEDQLDEWRPIFDAAWSQRVPLIFTDVTEASAMAKAIGFGLEGEVVVAESLAPTPGFRLHQLGDRSEVIAVEELEAGAMTEPTVFAGPSASSDEILALVDALTELPEIAADGSYPTGSYALYEVAPSEQTTVITKSGIPVQTLTRNVGFNVELFSDISAERKYMVVNEIGSGVNAGTMFSNWYRDRGYYQEQVKVSVFPLHDAVTPVAHAPLGVNGQHTFRTSTNSSTSLAISAGVPTLSFSVGESTSGSVTMSDFTVYDESALAETNWRFRMNSTSQGPYSYWEDLIYYNDDVKAHHVAPPPALAQSTLVPQFEAVYWADESFEGIAKTKLDYEVAYQHVWTDGSTDHAGFSHGHNRSVAVDFSRVSLPREGTLRLHERWTEDAIPDRWVSVNDGTHDSADWEINPYSWAKASGNSWGIGPDGYLRGTYLKAIDSYMKDGMIYAGVWPADDGSWGYMYGIQDEDTYYRASIDKQLNLARIIRFDDGVGTVIAEAPCQPTLNAWNLLRLERSGTTHRLFLGDQQLLTASDNTYGTGQVGLYAAEMSAVNFAEFRIFRADEPDRNLALGRPTVQGSTVYGGDPGRAVDGGTHGDWLEGSVTHTDTHAPPYWQVDLGSMRTINEVTVWNRTDCCSERLANYEVAVLNDLLQVVATRTYPGVSPTRKDFDFGGVEGRHVRVRMFNASYLSLAEVEVWGR